MNILIFGDLHGSIPHIYFDSFDAVLAPGDFCPLKIGKYLVQAFQENVKNPLNRVRWHDLLDKKEAEKILRESLQEGRKTLEFLNSLNVPVYAVPGNWDWAADPESSWDFLRKDHYADLLSGLENIHDLHMKSREAGGFTLIGYGISSGPEIPQHETETGHYSREHLKTIRAQYDARISRLGALFQKAAGPVLFISHNIPFNK